MSTIKRCEKEVPGTLTDKRIQMCEWLDEFVPHYCARCTAKCPSPHDNKETIPYLVEQKRLMQASITEQQQKWESEQKSLETLRQQLKSIKEQLASVETEEKKKSLSDERVLLERKIKKVKSKPFKMKKLPPLEDDEAKHYLHDLNPIDQLKIEQLEELIDKIKGDVNHFIHGYNTCSVERAHSERTVYTSKRIEYWRSWEGRCKLVQLIHNYGVSDTVLYVLNVIGWNIDEILLAEIKKIDNDKKYHKEVKKDPSKRIFLHQEM